MDSLHPVRRRRIMVCTADPELQKRVGAGLAQHGFSVAAAQDHAFALNMLHDRTPDAMLCDQTLPGHDGMALLQQIRRERHDLADMPIIVISEFGARADIVAGKLAGADDYLAKPVDIDLLVASLETQLRVTSRVREAAIARHEAGHGSPRLEALQALLDRLSFGIELFDSSAQSIFANRLARNLSRTNSEAIRAWILRHTVPGGRGAGRFERMRPGVLDFRMVPTGVSRSNAAQHLFVVTLALTDPDDADPIFAAAIFPSAHGGALGGRLVADAIGLTPTETKLAGLLAEGLRLDQIGELMGIAKPTVNYHLRNIYQKSGASRQSDVINLLRAVHLAELPGNGQSEPPAGG
ncbi:response regulator [Paracoccus xiamenensis]|uniref:response regulator n=1 Tax=Paracoccus xiamenensis TaxID=2714901 RepID=UPI0014099B68|nr:response regulator [Paracoccus xiamenensis]NHF73098.1 response regulator [Paracoccus xiamenensis]